MRFRSVFSLLLGAHSAWAVSEAQRQTLVDSFTEVRKLVLETLQDSFENNQICSLRIARVDPPTGVDPFVAGKEKFTFTVGLEFASQHPYFGLRGTRVPPEVQNGSRRFVLEVAIAEDSLLPQVYGSERLNRGHLWHPNVSQKTGEVCLGKPNEVAIEGPELFSELILHMVHGFLFAGTNDPFNHDANKMWKACMDGTNAEAQHAARVMYRETVNKMSPGTMFLANGRVVPPIGPK